MYNISETEKKSIGALIDAITGMCYDLERGGFISDNSDGIVINDNYSLTYTRDELDVVVENNFETTYSNFEITVNYNDKVACQYKVFAKERKFTISEIDGFLTGMFLNVLDKFRKEKFNVQ